MKQMYGEINSRNDELVKHFVETAFEKMRLATQIDSLYDSLDDLGADLDMEARKLLFQNVSVHLKKLTTRLEQLESELTTMLPKLETYRDTTENGTGAARLAQIKSIAAGAAAMTAPMVPAKVQPDTPTLMAIEPAPMLSDEEYEDAFHEPTEGLIEEEESTFEHPAPPLIESENSDFSEDDTESISIHEIEASQVIPPVLFERGTEEPISLDTPIPRAEDISAKFDETETGEPLRPSGDRYLGLSDDADESWARPPSARVYETGEYAAATQGTNTPAHLNHTDETVVRGMPTREEPTDSLPLTDEERSALESLELDSIETPDPMRMSFDMPAPGEPGNLASVLEPDAEDERSATELVDPVASAHWDEDEPPTIDLGSSLEGSSTEENILFWRQQSAASSEAISEAMMHTAVTTPPKASTTDAEEDLTHIDDYDESDEAVDADQTDAVEVEAESDETLESSEPLDLVDPMALEDTSPLEQELYEMINMQKEREQPVPRGAKQTLVGLGVSTIEKVNALSAENDTLRNEGTN